MSNVYCVWHSPFLQVSDLLAALESRYGGEWHCEFFHIGGHGDVLHAVNGDRMYPLCFCGEWYIAISQPGPAFGLPDLDTTEKLTWPVEPRSIGNEDADNANDMRYPLW